jgi:DNA-binding protein HU-beta
LRFSGAHAVAYAQIARSALISLGFFSGDPRARSENQQECSLPNHASALEEHQHMNRRDLVNAIAAQTGQAPRDVDATLKGFTDVVTAVVSKGEPVAISGFAKFVKRSTPARVGRNPQTGEPVQIPARTRPRVTLLKAFKDGVMTPSQAPKLNAGVWPPAPKKAAPAKKAAAKAPAKKAPAKKAPAAKKKAPAKKAPAAKKKAPAKKAAAKRR